MGAFAPMDINHSFFAKIPIKLSQINHRKFGQHIEILHFFEKYQLAGILSAALFTASSRSI